MNETKMGEEAWHLSNFSWQMDKNTVLQDFVQQMNSRNLPGFHLAVLVLLKQCFCPQLEEPWHCSQGPWLLILAAEEVQINNHQCLVLGRCVGQPPPLFAALSCPAYDAPLRRCRFSLFTYTESFLTVAPVRCVLMLESNFQHVTTG